MTDWIGQKLGNYQLTQLLGEGGFAEVYLGEHIHLGTQAAIKILHTQLASDDMDIFRKEARTIAHLVHPNIVRVLEFGIEGKTPFLVMDYAPNGTLRRKHPKGTRVPLGDVVPYVKQIADALQYAHDEKLIHRDIKPENMLVGRRNDILLGDFGIALVAQSSRYQNTQDMAGTIAYMAPEQIQGKPRPASDQYALAITVYEWLSGDKPFHGSFTEIAVQHTIVPPPPLRERVPVSPSVEQVVMIALAKEPKERFGSIQAFATALEQASQGEQATTISPKSYPVRVSSAPPIAPTVAASSSLAKTPPYSYSSPPQGTALITYEGHAGPVVDACWSPDARYIVSGGKESVIHIWEASSGKSVSSYRNQVSGITTVVWSPRGDLIASISDDGIIQVWRAHDGKHTGTYSGHKGLVKCIAWSPDGSYLVSSSPADNNVHVWDATKSRKLLTYKGNSYGVQAVAWSPDGSSIASMSKGYMIHTWDARRGKDIATQGTYYAGDQGHRVHAHLLAWSPDAGFIASVSPKKTIQIWDRALKKSLCTYEQHNAEVYSVAWSPDGSHIASTGADKTVHIWNAKTGQTAFIFRGHRNSVYSALWSSDGRRIASASADGTVLIWQV